MTARTAMAGSSETPVKARISALYYYPIKSCGGTRVERMSVVETGPLHDRELMVVDARTGVFLTQREFPQMACVTPTIRDGHLYVSAPAMALLDVALVTEGERCSTTIWKDHVESVDQGDVIAAWFSHLLGCNVRVVRKAPHVVRQVDPIYATSPTDQVSFADGYPFLLLSQESLTGLNQRLADSLLIDRFRPNIVIEGCPTPHYEDTLGQFTIGEISLSAVKPCARCKTTTVNQATGQIGKEPLQTLATYRRGPSGSVTFGMNVIHHTTGWLAVGDCVVAGA